MFKLKNRKKMRELKHKLAETRKIDDIKKLDKGSKKAKLKAIRRANKLPHGTKDMKNEPGDIINVHGVNKTYISGELPFVSLKNVNLSIKKGAFAVILGESGSGKTSLLNVLSGLDRATFGDIIIGDINISALKDSQLTTFRRNNVGFIFQQYNLLMELNAKDNAEMGRQLQIDNNLRLDIDNLFEKSGLDGKQKTSISDLSGGQLQRVSIIRALSKNPKIIFADEPTGALDSATSEKIVQIFKSINKKYKTTIVLVTHDNTISKHADQIINVKDGRVFVENKK